MESQNHEHNHSNEHGHQPKKKFFEKYQTFFSIIIAGLLIAGGIFLGKVVSNPSSGSAAAAASSDTVPTQAQVRAMMIADAKYAGGVNIKKFEQCIDTGADMNLINSDIALAQASGVQGTPTFFILERTYNADGSVATDKQFPVVGAQDETTFLNAISTGIPPAGQPALPAGSQKIVLTPSDHYLGPKNAAVTIVEYSDIDCPFCRREKPIVDDILKQHPEYAFVYRQSPIVQLHPWANYKANASECVNDQGGPTSFWRFMSKAVIPLPASEQ